MKFRRSRPRSDTKWFTFSLVLFSNRPTTMVETTRFPLVLWVVGFSVRPRYTPSGFGTFGTQTGVVGVRECLTDSPRCTVLEGGGLTVLLFTETTLSIPMVVGFIPFRTPGRPFTLESPWQGLHKPRVERDVKTVGIRERTDPRQHQNHPGLDPPVQFLKPRLPDPSKSPSGDSFCFTK